MVPSLFKMIAQHTLPSLAKVLLDLLDQGAIPPTWRRAVVTPIHKRKGKLTDDV